MTLGDFLGGPSRHQDSGEGRRGSRSDMTCTPQCSGVVSFPSVRKEGPINSWTTSSWDVSFLDLCPLPSSAPLESRSYV